ncbi:exopolysaccharide biosynthesis protein [bacterium]|nr:exopolysaccharide biosynthesis protein [bacterium]
MLEPKTLAEDLRSLADEHDVESISLGTILEKLGHRGFGLLLIVLSLPSAMPMPAPGYSTPFGIIIILLGLQMMIGRRMPALPKWALHRKMKAASAARFFHAGARFFHKTEFLIKPRLSWMGSRAARVLISVLVMMMAALMILPIPLTNTFPAMVIFLIGVGLTERDGIAILLATVMGWVAVAVYGVVIYFIYYLGTVSADEIKELFKGLLGLG